MESDARMPSPLIFLFYTNACRYSVLMCVCIYIHYLFGYVQFREFLSTGKGRV